MQSIVSVISSVASAAAFERLGQLDRRNAVAVELFAQPVNRLVVDPVTGHSVETWYDRRTRNWTTYRKDATGWQVGPAEYAGDRLGAAILHTWALSHLFNFTSR